VTPRSAGAIALAAVLTLGACGTTYVDPEITVPPTGPTTTTTLPPVSADTPTAELLSEIQELVRHLDERIVDDDHTVPTLARIDELWDVAEQQIRDRDPDQLYPFEQAIALVHTGVERSRPADASKAYKLLIAAIDAYGPEG
jgi:hypothetical protein